MPKIILEKSEIGWNVEFGELSSDSLSNDEALACVASILFGGCTRPLYLMDPIRNMLWESKYKPHPLLLTEAVEP